MRHRRLKCYNVLSKEHSSYFSINLCTLSRSQPSFVLHSTEFQRIFCVLAKNILNDLVGFWGGGSPGLQKAFVCRPASVLHQLESKTWGYVLPDGRISTILTRLRFGLLAVMYDLNRLSFYSNPNDQKKLFSLLGDPG